MIIPVETEDHSEHSEHLMLKTIHSSPSIDVEAPVVARDTVTPALSDATAPLLPEEPHSGHSDLESQGGPGLVELLSRVKAERLKLQRLHAMTVPIDRLRPNPRNPRNLDHSIDGLAASISDRGILQPIIVRRTDDEHDIYEIVAGERRWRAAQHAGLRAVPVILREVNEQESFELAIIENVQRSDLCPLDQAAAYQTFIHHFGYTQEEVARVIGKSRSCVSNTIRLLQLPETIKALVRAGKLSASQARNLIGMPDADVLAKEIVAEQLSVRQIEMRSRNVSGRSWSEPKRAKMSRSHRDNNQCAIQLAKIERRLSSLLGQAVTIDVRIEQFKVCIKYTSFDQIENLVKQLEACVSPPGDG